MCVPAGLQGVEAVGRLRFGAAAEQAVTTSYCQQASDHQRQAVQGSRFLGGGGHTPEDPV